MKTDRNLTIGIDIDGTVTCPSSLLPHLNQAFGKNLSLADCLEYDLANVYGVSAREMNEWFANNSDRLCRVAPVHGAADLVLREWYQKHRLVYISARHQADWDATLHWFEMREIPHHHIELIGSHDKVAAAKRWNVDMFIEDRLENALQLSEELEIPVFLFDTPYNQATLPKLVHRIYDWRELERLVTQVTSPFLHK
ncbi:hypothetical protein ACTID9_19935 [Brevibacillus fluminis]|uniref:hypothetical protein n=1 Tax=Brevibacillus fluminis TaxID=511487 RepID=UPI003F8BE73E